MSEQRFKRIATIKTADEFVGHVRDLGIELPCAQAVLAGGASPLSEPIDCGPLKIGNRFTIQPMEGWDGTLDLRIPCA